MCSIYVLIGFFLLMATRGEHVFFEQEKQNLRDARRVPIRFSGYAISYKSGHPHVRMAQDEYKVIKSSFEEIATRRCTDQLSQEIRSLPFEPYAPVRRQLLNLVRAINKKRKTAGLEQLPWDVAIKPRRCQYGPLTR